MSILSSRLCGLLFLLVLTPFSVLANYTLFATQGSGPHTYLFDMDSNGTLSVKEKYLTTYSDSVVASPNGRLVCHKSFSTICLYFLSAGGPVDMPKIYSNGDWQFYGFYPVYVFHPVRPILFMGTYPQMLVFDIDYKNRTINEMARTSAFYDASGPIGFSLYANAIVAPCFSRRSILSCQLGPEGVPAGNVQEVSFDESSYPNGDLQVSPDGRWIAVTDNAITKMKVFKINRDASMEHVQTINYDYREVINANNLFFTCDSQRLFLFNEGLKSPILYDVDSNTGWLTERRSLNPQTVRWVPLNFTVTHDLRWGVFRSLAFGTQAYLNVIEIRPDGEMILRPEKQFYVPSYLEDLQFAPPYPLSADTPWNLYE